MPTVTLTGIPASPGEFAGVAFVPGDVISIVPRGCVLVLKMSSMNWLEGLIAAGAVVTEVGGRTSHAATICRELGKPCVTAVADATSRITEGIHVCVNGTLGSITFAEKRS